MINPHFKLTYFLPLLFYFPTLQTFQVSDPTKFIPNYLIKLIKSVKGVKCVVSLIDTS